jgi:hypothetical protein
MGYVLGTENTSIVSEVHSRFRLLRVNPETLFIFEACFRSLSIKFMLRLCGTLRKLLAFSYLTNKLAS